MGPGEQAFGLGGGATPFLDQGWSKQEPWGVWSEARTPTLKHALLDSACLNMRFKVQAHVTKTGGPMTVQVKIGETPAATWTFTDAVAKEVTLPCPALGTSAGAISFTPSYAVSPKQAGESADPRPLGIALVSVKLEQASMKTRRF